MATALSSGLITDYDTAHMMWKMGVVIEWQYKSDGYWHTAPPPGTQKLIFFWRETWDEVNVRIKQS